jgi:hypothetical protein
MQPHFRRVGRWFLALSAASALVVASTVAQADDGDGDTIDEEIEDQAERAVGFHGAPAVDPLKMWVVSQSIDAPVRDWFKVSFDSGEFSVVYTQEAPFLATSFDLELEELIEWDDRDNDGRYDPATESLSKKSLGSSAFGGALVTHNERWSAASGAMHTIRVASVDNEIELELLITQRFYLLPGGRILTPMEMKLNLTVNHVLTTPGAGVAFRLQMDTDHVALYEPWSWDAVHGFSQDESWVNVTGGSSAKPATVFFSWSNNATVDGATKRVHAWGPDGTVTSGSYDVYLAYPAGLDPSRITVRHDSTLGVVSAAFESVLLPPPPFRPFAGDPVLYGSSVATIAAIVAATMILAKRRRRAA